MVFIRFFILLIFPIISLYSIEAAAEETLRELLIGYWYGNTVVPEQQIDRKWITHLDKSGAFEIFFREYRNDSLLKSWAEIGTWDVQGTIHSTTINRIVMDDGRELIPDTAEGVYYDEYEVLLINDKILKYRHISDNVMYTVKRVPAGMEIQVRSVIPGVSYLISVTSKQDIPVHSALFKE